MRTIRDLLAGQADLAGLPDHDLAVMAECGRNVVVRAGELLGAEGEPADTCFVLRAGRVGLEVHTPGVGSALLMTLGPGELLGWSWLVPPHRWTADARALTDVRAIQLDGACLRRHCTDDPAMGFRLMQRMAGVLAGRLQATRLQLLDLYADRPPDRSPTPSSPTPLAGRDHGPAA
jgi:CRP/FNR family transcriptional regulator, cyclic AMP receptor protein